MKDIYSKIADDLIKNISPEDIKRLYEKPWKEVVKEMGGEPNRVEFWARGMEILAQTQSLKEEDLFELTGYFAILRQNLGEDLARKFLFQIDLPEFLYRVACEGIAFGPPGGSPVIASNPRSSFKLLAQSWLPVHMMILEALCRVGESPISASWWCAQHSGEEKYFLKVDSKLRQKTKGIAVSDFREKTSRSLTAFDEKYQTVEGKHKDPFKRAGRVIRLEPEMVEGVKKALRKIRLWERKKLPLKEWDGKSEMKQEDERIRLLWDKTKGQDREILKMKMEDRTQAEIGEKLGMSQPAVNKRLRKLRRISKRIKSEK